jgi:hypothetical protein
MGQLGIGDLMRTYAGDAVRHARKGGAELDYSAQSLVEVDRALRRISKVAARVRQRGAEPQEDAVWTLAKMHGGHVGEVESSPPEKVFHLLTDGEEEGVVGWYDGLQASLGQGPSVSLATASRRRGGEP